MAKNLIDYLTPLERLFLFVVLGGNGLFWVSVAILATWLLGWHWPMWGFATVWAVTTLYGLWILGKIHDAKIQSGEIEE